MLFKNMRLSLLLLINALIFLPQALHAEEFQCQVMSLEGEAHVTNSEVSKQPLKVDDLLKTEDVVDVGAGSAVDLAYDSGLQNVTRLEENTKIEIRSIYPTDIKMVQGGIFAKLKSLPKESTFQVETPTAIAAARGTEYRTVYGANGTEVYNFSESDIFVFNQSTGGTFSEEPLIVKNAEMAQAMGGGIRPAAPVKMPMEMFRKGMGMRQNLEQKIKMNAGNERFKKLPNMEKIQKIHAERMKEARQSQKGLVSTEAGQGMSERMKKIASREENMLKKMDRSTGTIQERKEFVEKKREKFEERRELNKNGNQAQGTQNKNDKPQERRREERKQGSPPQKPPR